MNVQATFSEVVDLLTDVIEGIEVAMTADPENIESMWTNVADREVDAILEESGWTREGVLCAIHNCGCHVQPQFEGLTDLLQCAN